MRPVSAEFITAIQGSYRLSTMAVLTDAAGLDTIVPITDGTVTLDQRAAIRGRCDVSLVDDGTLGLVPTSPASPLAPYGTELRLARGLTYPNGLSELVSLGIFRIQSVNVDDAPGGQQLRVTGLDRASRYVDARFEAPYTVAAGTNYATAIAAVLYPAWPGALLNFTATALVTPTLLAQEGDDRWQFAQDMAKAISMRLYFDGDGELTLTPDVLGSAVATIAEGPAGVLLDAGREWTREGTFNRVIATGENTGEAAPSRGVATDDNPLSPTYYYGAFGKVPRFYSSPFITTDAQAAAAAQSILLGELGTTEQVSFGSLVLPHLEPSDTVQITRLRAGIDEEHIIDSLTIPLSATGTMAGQTRARQITS